MMIPEYNHDEIYFCFATDDTFDEGSFMGLISSWVVIVLVETLE